MELRSRAGLAPALLVSLVLAAPAAGQALNVDLGDDVSGAGVPGPTHSGATGQGGVWNVWYSLAGTNFLVDADGEAKSVFGMSFPILADFHWPHAPLPAGDAELMLDAQEIPAGSSAEWNFGNLAPGVYRVVTYAWDPRGDGGAARVEVVGAQEPEQVVAGGAWSGGAYEVGVTHARHTLPHESANDIVRILVSASQDEPAYVNGFQFVPIDATPAAYCEGDGSGTPCPCGNAGAGGHGCESSAGTGGGLLGSLGMPNAQAGGLRLVAKFLPASTSALFFQGTAVAGGGAGEPFGDGLRCVGGHVLRLATKAASAAGIAQLGAGVAGDPPLSRLGGVEAGDTRFYQVRYRDLGDHCTPSEFNLTNALRVDWF